MEAAIDASHWVLRAWTGSFEMSVFQMLFEGKTEHVVEGGGAAAAGTMPRTAAARTVMRKTGSRAIPHAISLLSKR
ncbi:MAG: hypothetical protein E6I31_10090 [Chloroflexi bacterium]|nr:MAG: hypothetical protein E6I31_10090 [Chloroflexota bacterium]